MKLVFIHGWGFSPAFWDGLAAHLPEFKQRRIDLGFFGPESLPVEDEEPAILVGHSFGFVHGLTRHGNWRGWIAVNGFPRFVKTRTLPGCVPAVELRGMRLRLKMNPEKTLRDFHDYIGATSAVENHRQEKLAEALGELQDCDISAVLETLAVPGLVLAARNDPLVPTAASEALAENRAIRWHDSGGHVLPQSNPAWCAASIRDFVKSHEQKCA